MNGPYYAGHGINWMQEFLDAVPKWYHKDIAFCLACAIHHLYIIKKSNKLKLNHKILSEFCIVRQRVAKYLQFFKDAGLIDYQIQRGSTPKVTLLKVPNTNKQLINNKQLTNKQKEPVTNRTGKLLQTEQVPVTNITGSKIRKRKEPREQGSKTPKQGNQPSKEARHPSKATNQARKQGTKERRP